MLTDSLVEDEVVNSDYNFADGDLSAFQSEFSQPKQDMGISDIETFAKTIYWRNKYR